MARTIAIVLAVLVAAFLILAATQPDTFRVQRSTLIQAPQARVHALIDDFDRWQSWSPWEKKDPAMKRVRNVAEFVLRPEGGATRVTWTMHGPTSYVGKLVHTVIDMDQMVGKDFEAGLANLKSLTEG